MSVFNSFVKRFLQSDLQYYFGGNMPYLLNIDEKSAFGKNKFVNAAGNTECVEFIREATDAPGSPK